MTERSLHPLVVEAAAGRSPDWARIGARRLTHIEGVVSLMERWSEGLGLSQVDRTRWLAAAYLHDALRDAQPDSLVEAAEYPPKIRHGPAVAIRLEAAGVDDTELLEAIRYHSVGCPSWKDMGRFLYLADFLEPGRAFAPARLAAWRARLPEDRDEVLRLVCACRLTERLRRGVRLRPESVEFWNSLRGEA
jgi:HD superfamily phosphohydrolase YqeK